MKLSAAAVGAGRNDELSRLPAVLLFGPDRGLVRELAQSLVIGAAGGPDDPFRVTVLQPSDVKADPARLQDELNAIPFTGGRRVVWLREAADGLASTVEDALSMLGAQAPERRGALVIEAGDLEFRSSLRKLLEGHPKAAAVLCGGSNIAEFLRDELRGMGLNATPAALGLLADRVSGDRALARAAIEKLHLYIGPGGGAVDEAEVLACVEDPETAGFQDVIDALMAGDVERLDASFRHAAESGLSAVGLLRAAARALQRVDLVVRTARTSSLETAMGALRPPVPYSQRADFAAHCRSWSPAALDEGLARLMSAESQCKTTGLPEEAIASRVLLALAMRRRSAGRGRA